MRSLRENNVIPTLFDAIKSKDINKKEGALLAVEALIGSLGRMFEPYLIKILPSILTCFGDGDRNVRETAGDTARAAVKHLRETPDGGLGVKLFLPSLLSALQDKSWRTKQGATEMLGSLSHCAPLQLSSSLPLVVPRLIAVLADTHPEVIFSAKRALYQVGSVIKNQELRDVSEELLQAIIDPVTKIPTCLKTLLNTKFVHFIDAPSLALVMPVLQRALKDHSTSIKTQACRILGIMAGLADVKDLSYYFGDVIPRLQVALVDSNPEVRAESARALGLLASGMDEKNLHATLSWLVETLKNGATAVDRSGAAQGLSFVLHGLDPARIHAFLPEFLASADAVKGVAKEGFLMVFFYLPEAFGDQLAPFIGALLPTLLKGLAEEDENVRDTALHAGQILIKNYSDECLLLLLPNLVEGTRNACWRTRFGTVHLLGDLLRHLSGASGIGYARDEDSLAIVKTQAPLVTRLGEECTRRLFSLLFVLRTDLNGPVKEVAARIWKDLVHNTVVLLSGILPDLLDCILAYLGSPVSELSSMARASLEDVVRRLGTRVVPELLLILETRLKDPDQLKREGLCLGLACLLTFTSREQAAGHINQLVPLCFNCLSDPSALVRKAAAGAFPHVITSLGPKHSKIFFFRLLGSLAGASNTDLFVDGLCQVMLVKSEAFMPHVASFFLERPLSAESGNLLAQLVTRAGEVAFPYIGSLLDKFINKCSEEESFVENTRVLLYSLSEAGVDIAIDTLLKSIRSEQQQIKDASCLLLSTFCLDKHADCRLQRADLLLQLILLFDSKLFYSHVKLAVDALLMSTPPENYELFVPAVHNGFTRIYRRKKMFSAFSFGKGIDSFLPLLLGALVNASSDHQELAAQSLGILLRLTPLAKLSTSSFVKIVGRLIFRCGNGGAVMVYHI
jgi:hypothetical protein